MAALSFTVHEAPVPKARARVMAAGYSFTPKRVRDFEAMVRVAAMAAIECFPAWPKAHPAGYKVRVAVYRARAQGDLDNFVKSATDGMNTIVYPDDKHIREIHALLFDDKADPRLLVEVETLGGA